MLGALIGAGASILGNVLGNKNAEKQADQQYQHQKEFAQSGIQWKVKDAAKAGIHPLYALGAQTTSYQPTSVGGTDFGLPDAGQNIGRAIDVARSSPEQRAALALTASQIEGVKLDNEMKRTQLASAIALANQNQTSLPGPFTQRMIPGQGNTPVVDDTRLPLMHNPVQPDYTTNMRAFGRDYQPNPAFSNAQSYEDRYGEMSDWVAGPAIAAADYWYNVYKPRQRAAVERAMREGRIRER